MKNSGEWHFFMSWSMVDVSSDGDLNFPRVEKCKWCKSSRLHLGSAGTAGDWGKANTKCGRAVSTALDRSTTLGTLRVPVENACVITLITPLSSMLFIREREINVREIFSTILTLIMMIRMVISGLSVLVSQNRGCSGVVSSSRWDSFSLLSTLAQPWNLDSL